MRQSDRVWYGQAVVGLPGSGKSTYCEGMRQYISSVRGGGGGGGGVYVISLDPANERARPLPASHVDGDTDAAAAHLPPCASFEVAYDVSSELVDARVTMDRMGLGPNGALLYCMEYIEKNFDAVVDKICEIVDTGPSDASTPPPYLIFDFPGQIELFTHNDCVRNILRRICDPPADGSSSRPRPRRSGTRLCAVNLVDATFCTDAPKFIAASLLSASVAIRLELPCVHVLSKLDLLLLGMDGSGDTAFGLDFFTELPDLARLLDHLDSPPLGSDADYGDPNAADEFSYLDDPAYQKARAATQRTKFASRRRALHERMCELVDDFNLVSFLPLDVQDGEAVGRVLSRFDRTNGYGMMVRHAEGKLVDLWGCAAAEHEGAGAVRDVVERYRRMRERGDAGGDDAAP